MAPAAMPRTGLPKAVMRLVNEGLSARPATESLIVSIPNISTAKPRRIPPTSFFVDSPLQAIMSMIPTAARTGENDEGLSRVSQRVLPSIPVRDNIQEVMVVPTFAPIMMPTACPSFMMPEFTNPTTITVVAEDD